MSDTQDTLEAYLLISVEPKSMMQRVEEVLTRLPRVYEIMEVLGAYEIMMRIKTRDKDQLASILDKIRSIDGVKDCLVLVVTKRLYKR